MKSYLVLSFAILVIFILESVTAPGPDMEMYPGFYMQGEYSYVDVTPKGCSSNCNIKRASDARKKTECTKCCKQKDKAHIDGRCEKAKWYGYKCVCMKRVEQKVATKAQGRRNISPVKQSRRNIRKSGSGRW